MLESRTIRHRQWTPRPSEIAVLKDSLQARRGSVGYRHGEMERQRRQPMQLPLPYQQTGKEKRRSAEVHVATKWEKRSLA